MSQMQISEGGTQTRDIAQVVGDVLEHVASQSPSTTSSQIK